MAIGPPAALNPVPASPPRVGLITSARTGDSLRLDPRWGNGFAYEPENYCSANGVVDPCESNKTLEPDNREIVTVDPVALWAGDACSTYQVRDREARARRRLEACQSKLLAGELWEGTLAQASARINNKYLASPDANTISLASLAVSDGLACMEQALADCSCSRSMIHVTNGLMIYLARDNLVTRVGDVFVTANDTLVVADAGYTGTGPEGQAAVTGAVWAYGTDIVNVALDTVDVLPRSPGAAEGVAARRGDIEAMGQVEGLYDNSLTYRAERLAAAWWDGCCHLALAFDIDTCTDLVAS
jgi:hypothetical protein